MRMELRAGLLAAALLLPSASFAAGEKPVGPAAWEKARDDARRWTDAVLAAAAKAGAENVPGFRSEMERAWGMAQNAESAERRLNEQRLRAAPKQAAQEQKILELNLLYVYGCLLPEILEESAMTYAPGRGRAGGELARPIDETRYQAESAALSRSLNLPAELAPRAPAL